MERFTSIYNYCLSRGDPRVKDWFGMDSPVLTLAILIAYVLTIIIIKNVMHNRKPYELKTFMIIYNAFQVVSSFYIFYEILAVATNSKYSMTCQPVDYSNNPDAVRIAKAMWVYYVMKLIDLIDTVIFALRKKQNQISFLHVFHHFSMVLNAWSGVKYVAGGQTFFLTLLNSLVHTIMYAYYGLAALGPQMQKYLWWKRYLTQLQLIQFGFVMVHSVANLLDDKCPYPKGFSLAFVIYGVFITSLFLNFYSHSYSKEKLDNNIKRDNKKTVKSN